MTAMKPYRFRHPAKIALLTATVASLGIQSGIPHHKDNPSANHDQPEASPKVVASASACAAACASASSLASAIANDAGGHPDQYAFYAESLARTLSQFSSDQMSRVFKD